MQAVAEDPQDCGGASVLMTKAHQPLPLAVGEQLEGEASGGASSGKSEPDAICALGTPEQQQPAAPTAHQAGDEAHTASPAPAAADLSLAPLAPPDASEGPEAAAEYEAYLQRWEAGDTLAQRWHRLTQSGKLADIRAEWDDWQLDLMLVDVRTKTAAALKEQARAAAGFGPGVICSTRLRRGRGEVQQEADESPSEEPRRVRSRRAPATLQDYQVDAAAAAAKQTPERTPDAYADAPASRQQQQQQQLTPGTEPASEESTDEAEHNVAGRAQQQAAGGQPQQQQQQTRPPGRRGPLPAQPPKRVITRVQRSGAAAAPQQTAAQTRPFNRVITPYNPAQLHQQQMQAQAQAQQMIQAMAQEQQQVAAAAAVAGVSPEMLDEFYAMGSRLGAAFGQGEGGPAGGLAQNPAAMAAFMHALYQYGANPSALAQQVSSVMGGHQ